MKQVMTSSRITRRKFVKNAGAFAVFAEGVSIIVGAGGDYIPGLEAAVAAAKAGAK